MYRKRKRNVRSAMTLVEVLVAAFIFIVVVMGTLLCRYSGSQDVMRAERAMDARRLALVLLESWKGMGGTGSYDPIHDIGTVEWQSSEGPETPQGMNHQGSFTTSTPSGTFFATLSYHSQTTTMPILLHVSVGRMPPGQPWDSSTAQPMMSLASYFVSRGPQ